MKRFAELARFEPERVLLRAPNWLGDCVMAVPSMKMFRDMFPASRITVAATEPLGALFRMQSWCDDTAVIRLRGPLARYRSSRALAESRCDMAVLYPNSAASALETVLARVPVRVGYARGMRRVFLTHPVRADREILRLHHVLYYVRLARAVAERDPAPPPAERPPCPVVEVTAEMEERAGRLIRDLLGEEAARRAPVVAAPGAAYGSAKAWPAANVTAFASLVKRRTGLPLVLVGSAADGEVCARIERDSGGAAVSLCGRTGVGELAGVLSRARGYAGNDSGASHLAAALGIPAVTVFGPTDPERTRPLGPRAGHVFLGLSCSPCFRRACPRGVPRCMEEVSAEAVFEKLEALGGFEERERGGQRFTA